MGRHAGSSIHILNPQPRQLGAFCDGPFDGRVPLELRNCRDSSNPIHKAAVRPGRAAGHPESGPHTTFLMHLGAGSDSENNRMTFLGICSFHVVCSLVVQSLGYKQAPCSQLGVGFPVR